MSRYDRQCSSCGGFCKKSGCERENIKTSKPIEKATDDKEILTLSESGKPLTVELEGITMPADYSFACVNDYVHRVGTQFEELQALCLGMANHIEKLEKEKVEYEWITGVFWRLHKYRFINSFDDEDGPEIEHLVDIGLAALKILKPHLFDETKLKIVK